VGSILPSFRERQRLYDGKGEVAGEINLKDLNQKVLKLFTGEQGSIWKEWQDWLRHKAVIPLTDKEVGELPKHMKIVGMRWVHTDKNERKRVSGTKTANLEVLAKSRLVVQGCQERADDVRSDSPTASLFGFLLVCCISAMEKFTIFSADADCAFLQGGGIQRLLVLRAPNPPPPGVQPGQLFRACASIYGTKDAGRGWWERLREVLLRHGWVESYLERCLFVLFAAGTLVGILISHVDDLFYGGRAEHEVFERAVRGVQKDISMNIKAGSFTYCGKDVKQKDDYSIVVSQPDSCLSLESVQISNARRRDIEALLTAEETTELRSGIGSLGWVARQGRADLLAVTSILAQSVKAPKIKHLIQLNKAIRDAAEGAASELWFHADTGIDISNANIFVNADASWANVDDPNIGERTKSQCGHVQGFCNDAVIDA
jgi:hypothetical protein